MTANPDSFVAKTSLDYIAEGYWQDFLAQRPIAGGISYESQLQACQLDESLASLQRIDVLLSQIKRDIVKSDIVNQPQVSAANNEESALLADDSFRNLLLFLAFYAGRVLARQWQSAPHWYSQPELRRRHAELSLTPDDFYQEMAVSYQLEGNDTANSIENHNTSSLFFALEPIGLRLFGNIDRQFIAVQGGAVASGLYQAVKERLQATINPTNNSTTTLNNTTTIKNVTTTEDNSLTKQPVVAETLVATNSIIDKNTSLSTQPSLAKHASEITADVPVASKSVANNSLVNKKAEVTPEIFTRLLTELDEVEVPQSSGIDDYAQARKTLDQFERHIARQNKSRADVVFSQTHQDARQQALLLLKKSADAGNTAAMLRLAMYELLGEGLTANAANNLEDLEANKETGVNLVKQAANAKDSRAQRLLSRLYYQGVGMPQDIALGKYWLEQAADNGHPEAITLNKEWQQAQLLIETQKQEQHSFKRYQLLIGAIAIAAVLLIIFV